MLISDAGPRAHRRQFVISRQPFLPDEDWTSTTISNEFHLSYQRDLPVQVLEQGGRSMMLLGSAIALAPGAGPDDLAGRFARIEWPYLYPDPSALLPIHYGDTPDGPLVTSSPSLAAQLGGGAVIHREIAWSGLNWTPPPAAGVAGIARLMRDQRLAIPTATAERVDCPIRPAASVTAARDGMAADLTTLAGTLKDRAGTTYLALTAGLDSRTLLASLLAAGTRFECVTQSFDGVKPADIEIAGRISRHLGVRHHVIGPEAFDEAALRLWREHGLESYSDADDAHLIPQNQYRFLGADDTLVRGGCFEFGRRFYASRFVGLNFGNATGASLWSRFEATAPHPPTVAALDAWLDWRRRHDDGLDLVDSFYLDQRAGGWLSAVEHGLDMLPGRSLPAANCSRILSALITPPEPDRSDGRLQRDVIRLLEPGLLRFPVNPVGFGDRAVRLLHRTRDGIKRRIKRVLPEAMVRRLRR
ncbi:hypothetical protein JMJ56_14245 [Belnapia sp. T18]|uniref:Asparagine synthase (Glutamine-hydrolysing) n=1 Tax=Belnapia arida TaxID=2804533 RepID=A0ABS1U3C2_9PROT|nr:hypothetical protein [Belnapia arida]MBL6079175.1 hypothetical protein [Belnapia arida]